MDSRLMWMWFQRALGYGHAAAPALLAQFGTPEAVYRESERELRACRLSAAMRERLADKSLAPEKEQLRRLLANGDWLLTPTDDRYPPLLKSIASPPLVLYGRGHLPDLSVQPGVAVIGSRHLSEYGRRVTDWIARELGIGGAVVISGCAEGGDETALNAAMDVGGRVLSVLPTGLDGQYPRSTMDTRMRVLANDGAWLTEYPYGTAVQKGTFAVRNRVISGLATGVCVTESGLHSGTHITAHCAREQGREVFAVPHDVTDGRPGTNLLIQEGARLMNSAEEILADLRELYPQMEAFCQPQSTVRMREQVAQPKPRHPLPESAGETARQVYAVLTDEPRPADEIAAEAGVPMAQVLAALTELELFGCAQSLAGRSYCIAN